MRLPFIIAASSVTLAAIAACSSSSGGSTSGTPTNGDGGGTSSSSSSGSLSSSGDSSVAEPAPTVLASGQHQPGGIASNGTVVAWTTDDDPGGGNLNGHGPIMTVAATGGTPATLVPSTDNGAELAIDATNVYWYGPDDNSINRAALAGGAPVQILKNLANSPMGMAVNATTFYWTNDVAIHDVLLTGGANTTFVTLSDAGGYEPQYNSQQLAVTATGVYMAMQSSVLAISPTGSTFATVATGQQPTALVADATSVYWANGGKGVMKTAAAGGAAPTMLAQLSITEVVLFMAVDETTLYFISLAGSLKKVPIGGGAAVTLAPAPSVPGGLAIDATNVYWTDVNGGNVYKLAK